MKIIPKRLWIDIAKHEGLWYVIIDTYDKHKDSGTMTSKTIRIKSLLNPKNIFLLLE